MKIRNGFVSNSSSSSFIVDLEHVSKFQYSLIQDKIKLLAYQDLKVKNKDTATWSLYLDDTDFSINIHASMDDEFDWKEYLINIDIPKYAIKLSEF